jgi:dTDP-4-dehydrorhamnose reductase
MRIYLTGASGFVGSNLAHVFARQPGAEVVAPGHEHVDLTEEVVVRRSVLATRPDAIVHAAIWNDPAALHNDRRRAWNEYVGATRNVVAAANAADAHVVLISTDWVFDGTQAPAAETEPPNPINTYGFLKACSELIVTENAGRGTIARIAGVQGIHRARPETPRAQDAGFGYLVASLVDALRAGGRFAVWDGPGLNLLATPTLATDAARMIWRALEREATGVLHCCGGEHVDRVGLARRAIDIFELDPDLLEVVEPPDGLTRAERVPRDTRLDATETAARLGVELPTLDAMLRRLRVEAEVESSWSLA